MLFDNYRSIKNYTKTPRKCDNYSDEDIIDRTGYVPLDLQFYRMMESGTNLTRVIDSQYNYDWKELEQAYNDNTLNVSEIVRARLSKRFMERSELHDEGIRLLEKFKNAKTESEKLKSLRDKYLKDKVIEDIRKEAINTYIAEKKQQQRAQKDLTE